MVAAESAAKKHHPVITVVCLFFFFFCFLYSTRKYNLLSIILVFVANWLGGRAVDDTPTAGAVAAGREDGAPLRRRRRVDGRSGRWAGPEVWLMRI